MDHLTITIDRVSGTADLRKGRWNQRLPLADLPRWRGFYARLWARGARQAHKPGPWAPFYSDDLAALDAAIRENGDA